MGLSFTVHENADYLHCEASGRANFADMRAGVDLARSLAANRGQKRVLIDMRGVVHTLPFTEHLQLGTYIAETLTHVERVASVVAVDNKVGVSAKVAQKLGMQLHTFDDVAEAEAWLRA